MLTRQSLYFTGPRRVEVRTEDCPVPRPGEVLVRTQLSAISPGTEMLIYRDQAPKQLALDESIAALEGNFQYPLKYGYAAVGEVVRLGEGVEADWLGQRIFAFNPHETHFMAPASGLMRLPEGLSPEDAAFLPNMETALNLVMDGSPVIGERVAVIGQGIVGLLTTALLARFPLEELLTLDFYANRREASATLGGHALHPDELPTALHHHADLIYELSGAPDALNTAIALAGFDSRIVAGSWYGEKRTALNLGGDFHRNRIQIISSQVSTIAPRFQGRWDKARRFATALQLLAEIRPARFITQRFPLSEAADAYRLLDEYPQQAIQVIFEY
ncbi:MAG: zinc-binding alcohol dehydrogenase [Chloroflexi bacterium]|nr:zinc-binding alcohol dehydrogenase [Chloroflexota bacterium]